MRRILLVDDDRSVRLAISAWLKHYGFRVAVADGSANGLAALDHANFDLMIVDIFMPHVSGFEAIRLFHQRAPAVPLIAISGFAFAGAEADNPACLKMALSLGATRCLCKPFRPATLLGMIDECLAEAEPHRRHNATLAAVVSAVSGQRDNTTASDIERAVTS
jgi:CheY-like chemotaxis protein